MPYGRRSFRRRRYSRKSRSHASSTIARAWKRRKRSRTGLLSRTVQANRRAVKRVSKSVETKVLQDTQAIAGNLFRGQYNDSISVDKDGQETVANLPFFADILGGLQVGPLSSDRIGAWVQLKSLTMKYCVSLTAAQSNAYYTIMMIHDSQPDAASGLSGVFQYTGAPPPPNNALDLSFLDLDHVGTDGRFKILWKKRHRLSLPATKVTGTTVPPIGTAQAANVPPGTAGGTWSNVGQLSYTPNLVGNTCKSYPASITSSVTLKLPYKLNYGKTGLNPANQTIRLCAFCTMPGGAAQPLTRLQYYIRVRYKDA